MSLIQEIIDANIVPRIIQLLECKEMPQMQYEAAWCVTNIAIGTQSQVQCLVDKGAVAKLFNLMSTANDQLKEMAIWALGNIAGENKIFREIVNSLGTIPALLNILATSTNQEVLKNGCWLFCNLIRGKENLKIEGAISVLCKLIKENDDKEIMREACYAFVKLCSGDEADIPLLAEYNILPRLMHLLK